MAYNEEKDVTESDTQRPSSEDLESRPLTGEDASFPLHKRKGWIPGNGSVFWKFYSLFMTIIAIILLLTLIQNNTQLLSKSKERTPPYHGSNCPELSQTPTWDKQLPSGSLAEDHDDHDDHSATSNPEDPLRDYPNPGDGWRRESLVETKFYRDLRYMTLDHDADYLWQEHLFMATGNIKLPPADGEGNATLKGIAMFHQMHCLAKMRMVLQMAREGIDIGVDWKDDAHWPHCFDYLRESILCYADPTLESVSLQPGPEDNGKFVKVIDGGAETRYCRDSKPLYELERHYGPNSQYGFAAAEDEFEVAPGK